MKVGALPGRGKRAACAMMPAQLMARCPLMLVIGLALIQLCVQAAEHAYRSVPWAVMAFNLSPLNQGRSIRLISEAIPKRSIR